MKSHIAIILGLGIASAAWAQSSGSPVNLVPSTLCQAPNYWCTWSAQAMAAKWQTEEDRARRNGSEMNSMQRHALDEKMLFDAPGFLTHGFDEVRSELWVVLDDGWDVPYQIPRYVEVNGKKADHPAFGAIDPDPQRFPSCSGTTGEQRMKSLNEKVRAQGWRGVGFWIACAPPRNPPYDEQAWAKFYRERLRWSHEAGIGLWKIDWGAQAANIPFRKMLTDLGREEAPSMVIEQSFPQGPFLDQRLEREKSPQVLAFADLFRTYDIIMRATTIARCGLLLTLPAGSGQGVLNVEDDPLVAAGLACTVGIMRHPLWNGEAEGEVTRLIRWQRLAPPYGVGLAGFKSSERVNTDRRPVPKLSAWALGALKSSHSTSEDGKYAVQAAPAVMARGLPLPEVRCDGEWPFVMANRNPNGCISIATEERDLGELGAVWPEADITLDVGGAEKPIGIFGRYRSLTLRLSQPLGARRVWLQDLKASEARDVTDQLTADGNAITLSKELLEQVGKSDPKQRSLGLVMAIR